MHAARTDFWRDWEDYGEAHSHREVVAQYFQSPQGKTLSNMVASRDRKAEEVDALQAELVTVEAEIARLQAKKTLRDESIVAAQQRVEEMNLQMEQDQREREERSWQFILPKANATRIKIKEIVRNKS